MWKDQRVNEQKYHRKITWCCVYFPAPYTSQLFFAHVRSFSLQNSSAEHSVRLVYLLQVSCPLCGSTLSLKFRFNSALKFRLHIIIRQTLKYVWIGLAQAPKPFHMGGRECGWNLPMNTSCHCWDRGGSILDKAHSTFHWEILWTVQPWIAWPNRAG